MATLIEQFKGRNHGPLVQFIKYAVGGGVATAVHISLFYSSAIFLFPALKSNDVVASLLHLHPAAVSDSIRGRNAAIDNTIAFIFSNLTAYLINIFWVFESGRHNRWVEIGFFYLVSGVSLFIGTTVMTFLIDHYHLMTTVAFTANIFSALLINFVLRKYVIFKK